MILERLFVAFIIVILSTALACAESSGSPRERLTLDQYVKAFKQHSATFDGRSNDLDEEFNCDLDGDSSKCPDYFREVAPAIEQYATALEGLRPPEPLDHVHSEVVAAIRRLGEVARAFGDLRMPADYDPYDERFENACVELEAMVASGGIDAELC